MNTSSDSFLNFLHHIYTISSSPETDIRTIQKAALILPIEYLYTLKQEILLKSYSSLTTLPSPILTRNVNTVKRSFEQEIVRRNLTISPKQFTPLEEFLLENGFQSDPLHKNLQRLSDVYRNENHWFKQETQFLEILGQIKKEDTSFREALSRILSIFQFSDYISNILLFADKGTTDSKSLDVMEDSLVRKISTIGHNTIGKVIPDAVSPDFEDTAETAQDALIAKGLLAERIEFKFADGLGNDEKLLAEGRSGGLAMAYLAYAWQKGRNSRLFPYIAICGSLDRSNFVGIVKHIQEKIRVAFDNGIRFVFIPESNALEIKGSFEENEPWGKVIDYPDGHLHEVINHIDSQIQDLNESLEIREDSEDREFSIKKWEGNLSPGSIVGRVKWYQSRLIQAALIFSGILVGAGLVIRFVFEEEIPLPLLHGWDFEIQSVELSPYSVRQGDKIRISTTVKNTGQIIFGTFYGVVKISNTYNHNSIIHDTHRDLNERYKIGLKVKDILRNEMGVLEYEWTIPDTLKLGVYDITIEIWSPQHLYGEIYESCFDKMEWGKHFDVLPRQL